MSSSSFSSAYFSSALPPFLILQQRLDTDDQEMWESEKHHLNVMSTLQTQHQVRPTLMYPLWKVMALGLGAGTGLMGREAAMACTEAVETVIGEHYDE